MTQNEDSEDKKGSWKRERSKRRRKTATSYKNETKEEDFEDEKVGGRRGSATRRQRGQ